MMPRRSSTIRASATVAAGIETFEQALLRIGVPELRPAPRGRGGAPPLP